MATSYDRKKKIRKKSKILTKIQESEIWKWWLDRKKEKAGAVKWKTLEHSGPVFAPKYQKVPRHVKFYYDGSPMALSQKTEEVAGFYGKMLKDKYTKKKKFNFNFFSDWRKVMEPKERVIITDFKKCDFEDFRKFYEEEAKRKGNKSAEERERIKKEKEYEIAKFGYCMVDGRKQKVINFRLEPPGLFRGRGNHPKMGKLKERVEAEDVTINIGREARVPKPPAGHQWREVIHDTKVTWLARWVDNISGKRKYVMLNPSSKLKGENDVLKYETARRLGMNISRVRRIYLKDLQSADIRLRQKAVAIYLIDRLALRSGNEKDEDTADTVGCCSLRVEHIKLQSEGMMVHFDFPGKDCVRYKNSLQVDERIFRSLQQFIAGKSRGCRLFDRLSPNTMNNYLGEVMEGLTAKVFRTYHASRELEYQLKSLTKKTMTLEEKLFAYNIANRASAVLCNHHRAVAKNYANTVKNMEHKISVKMDKIRELEEDNKQKYPVKYDRDDRLISKRRTKMVLLRKQVQKLQIQAALKDTLKDIALATSKLNYLDPRITVAWCMKWKVPIEKVYNKNQRERFQWAIETTNSNFKF